MARMTVAAVLNAPLELTELGLSRRACVVFLYSQRNCTLYEHFQNRVTAPERHPVEQRFTMFLQQPCQQPVHK